jgi:ABC-type transport system involved in cytochrome c biogenesis permease subunit
MCVDCFACLRGKQFLQSKRQGTGSTRPIVALLKPVKEINMEYLILVAVVAMMALYALIIVGCLKQPEW